jgi:hypothetical protein
LLLSGSTVYIAWASHGDNGPAHGWIMGYNETSLQQLYSFITTPDGYLGGIWMAGCGLAADGSGNIYCSTGNGTFQTDAKNHHTGNDWGDSLLKLTVTSGTLAVADSFTPINQNFLTNNDLDFGSGGVMLLPDQTGAHPHLGICCGKWPQVFVFNRDNLGGYQTGDKGAYEEIPDVTAGSFGTPSYFNGHIYYHGTNYGGNDVLKSFEVVNDRVSHAPVASGTDYFPFPGSTPTLSASGTSNGLVWEISRTFPATLIASAADNVRKEIYTSNDAGSRDQPIGNAVKFTTPTVVNGKVYFGTDSTLAVFGLLGTPATLTVNVNGPGTITPGFSGTSTYLTDTPLGITATPSAGAVFDSWTDGDGNVLSRSPTYSFTMEEGIVLNANFLPNPFPGFAGDYRGLIQGTSPAFGATGYFNLTVGKTGNFTATIYFDGQTYNISGAFNADGGYSVTLQPTSPNATTITLSLDGTGKTTGSIGSTAAAGNITGAVLATTAGNLAGKYTLLFPVAAGPTSPQGIGYGSATVESSGKIRLTGVLGDGTPFTVSSRLTIAGTWPLYTKLYAHKGVLIGTLTFETESGTSDLDGPLFWYKPVSTPEAFSVVTNAIGSKYQQTNPILPLTSGTGMVTLQLPSPISEEVTAAAGLTLTGAGPLTLSFDANSGLFTGKFTSGVKGTYGGAVYQDQNKGEGTYILSGTTGGVDLQ